MNLEALLSSLFQTGTADAPVFDRSAGQGKTTPFEFPAFLQAAAAETDADAAVGTGGSVGPAAAGSILGKPVCEGEGPDGSQDRALALLALAAEIRQAAHSIEVSGETLSKESSAPSAANRLSGDPASTVASSTASSLAELTSGGLGTVGTTASFDEAPPVMETAHRSAEELNRSAPGAFGSNGANRTAVFRNIAEVLPTSSFPGGSGAGRFLSEPAGGGESPRPALDHETAGFRQPGTHAGQATDGEFRPAGADRPAELRFSGPIGPEAGTTGSGPNVPGDSKEGALPGDDGRDGRQSARDHRSPAAMEALRSAAPPSGETAPVDPSRCLPVEDAAAEADLDGELKPGNTAGLSDRNTGRVESGGASTDPAVRTGRNFQNDPLSQLLDKAVFRLKNGQSEARISLKPEILGHVRLQIVTENHQVTLKILTEFPAVKEMIETNIGQLRADLQTHGLEIDELEVSVAGDSRNSEPHARESRHRRGERRTAAMEPGAAGEPAVPPAGVNPVSGTSAVIDFFV